MFKIITDYLWDMVFSEQGMGWFFQIMNLRMLCQAFDIQLFFNDFGISFANVQKVIYSYSIYLIILKFIKKILDVHALQTDGDANADISVSIMNFCKAVVISIVFTTIWSWVIEIAVEFGMDITASMNLGTGDSIYSMIKSIGESSEDTPLYIIAPVFAGLSCLVIILQMKNGVELWILRLGVPLACCGLLDADQGVFKQYMKLLLKEVLTIIIQIFLLNAGVFLLTFINLDNIVNSIILGTYAIMVIVVALATPKILSEFLVSKQSGGGKVMQAVYMSSFLLRGVM